MDQFEEETREEVLDHTLKYTQENGYRNFFMRFGPMRADVFLNPEFFRDEPDITYDALEALESIVNTNVFEELSEAMCGVRVLGNAFSREFFEANPALADRALEIFMRGLQSKSYSVRAATIEEIIDIILSSDSEHNRKQNPDTLRTLLNGVSYAQRFNPDRITTFARATLLEINEKFCGEDNLDSFDIDTLIEAISNS